MRKRSPRPLATLLGQNTRATTALLALTVSLGTGCKDDSLLAPPGATIAASVSPSVIASGGDTAILSLLVLEQDGTRVEDKTEVEVIAGNGEVCPILDEQSRLCSSWAGVAAVQTHQGTASLLVRSSAVAGTISLEMHSASATKSATVTVSSRVAPADGKIVLQPARDTIAVGESARILLFVATASGDPVLDETRIALSAPDNTLSKQIVLTHDGFAETTLTGVKAGDVAIAAISGTVRGSIKVTIR